MDELDQPLAGALVVAIAARGVAAQPAGLRMVGPRATSARPTGIQLVGMHAGATLPVGTRPVPAPGGEPPCPTWEDLLLSAAPVLTTTEVDGRFALPILPPGRYALFAIDIAPPAATSEALVVDGGFLLAPLRLVVSRGAALL